MKVLLDTNAYSALMRGHADVADRVRRAEHVLLSTIVAGELLFGFRAGGRLRKNLASSKHSSTTRTSSSWRSPTRPRTGSAASLPPCVPRDAQIPTNDIWIAAH